MTSSVLWRLFTFCESCFLNRRKSILLCCISVFKYVFQKMEDSEKRIVHEAKMKPDKHQRTAADMSSECTSARKQIDRPPEETEPLKVQ